MKTFYIAGLVPEAAEDGGGWTVYFPDVPNVVAGGETVEEAICMAEEGLALALQDLVAKNAAIPTPSTLEAVKEKVRAERELDELPYPEGPEGVVYQYIVAPSLDLVPVRINISIPRAALEEIDARAKLYGYTRSGFLAQAGQNWHPEHP